MEKTILPGVTAAEGRTGCEGCRSDKGLDIQFDYAFQPIVNVRSRSFFAHEALVRGPNGESARSVLSQVTEHNRYAFDQACRVKAVRTAAELGMQELLSINFLPNAVYRPDACIRSTFDAAQRYGFPTERIMFEVTEGENIEDRPHLIHIFQSYERFGFCTALDDFGAGYAGLNLLSEYQPKVLKLDMGLIRGIDADPVRQAIVKGTFLMGQMIGSQIVAEGVETAAERDCLLDIGIELMQGYLFCRPVFKSLGTVPDAAWG